MGAQGLAAFASGVTGSLFGGLLKDRQDQQERKDKELAMQLAAYHSLLEHPDTPESSIPDILDAQANLLKVGPQFKGVTDHMRQAMQQQIPSGPERETAQSGVNRTVATSTAVAPTTDTLATGLNLRPTNATPTSPGTVPMSPDAAPQTITTPALSAVPPEPQMYQPTKSYGEMTQGEASDYKKNAAYSQNQEAVLRRQLKLQDEAAANRADAEEIKAKGRKAEETLKQEGRIKLETEKYNNRKALLPIAEQAKMEGPRLLYKHTLMTGANPMNDADAEVASLQWARSQADAALGLKQSQIETNKARAKNFEALTAKDVEQVKIMKGRGTGIGEGVPVASMREFNLRTGTLRQQLSGAIRELATAKAATSGQPTPAESANIALLEASKNELIAQVDDVREEILARSAQGTRVPSVPGVATSSAPASAGSFDMRGWSQSHPNATEAERNAIRSKARARNLAVVE